MGLKERRNLPGKQPKRSATVPLNRDTNALENEAEYIDSKGIMTLRYEVDERGIGQLLIPPSLSLLLQSDRVSISPSAGGLFIRSV